MDGPLALTDSGEDQLGELYENIWNIFNLRMGDKPADAAAAATTSIIRNQFTPGRIGAAEGCEIRWKNVSVSAVGQRKTGAKTTEQHFPLF